MVPIEAMACGAPVVFGACGPHDEIIDDGVDGLICDPREPRDIADKILTLLGDDAMREAMGRAAREKAEKNFSLDVVMAQNLVFYERVIGEGRR